MKKIINYYYNLFPENIKNKYGGYYFEIQDNKYLLLHLHVPSKDIIEIYENLIKKNIANYILILNRDGVPVSTDNSDEYLLFMINCDDSETMKFSEQIYIALEGTVSWSKAWSERINYYEIQINELAQNKKVILQSIYYYIGLAENAIAIADKYSEYSNQNNFIQHYRMNVPIKKGEYFNPGNMLIDSFVRDPAEYIKSSFFFEKREESYYFDYINTIPLTDISANLLIARLLYPTYYFDIFDEVILNNAEENELISIINTHERYENFIINLYKKLKLNYQIIDIMWIKKRL